MTKNQFINVPVSEKFKSRVEAYAARVGRSLADVMRRGFESLEHNELASIPSTLVGVDSNSKLEEVVEHDNVS